MPAFVTRLIRFFVVGSNKPADGPGAVVRLVYARTNSASSEPLVAVCRTEAEARGHGTRGARGRVTRRGPMGDP